MNIIYKPINNINDIIFQYLDTEIGQGYGDIDSQIYSSGALRHIDYKHSDIYQSKRSQLKSYAQSIQVCVYIDVTPNLWSHGRFNTNSVYVTNINTIQQIYDHLIQSDIEYQIYYYMPHNIYDDTQINLSDIKNIYTQNNKQYIYKSQISQIISHIYKHKEANTKYLYIVISDWLDSVSIDQLEFEYTKNHILGLSIARMSNMGFVKIPFCQCLWG